MKSIILLTFAFLISTIGISQQLIVEHNGNDPVEIKTNNNKNISLYTTHGDRKGYLGIFSDDYDMDIGTAIDNNVGKVNLTIEGEPRLTVLPGDSINVYQNLIVNVADPLSPQDAATKAYVDANSSSSSGPYVIGDFAHGGVVFWVAPGGEHGKVVSIYDIILVPWSNINSISVGNSASSDINGAGNTVAIMMQTGHTSSAARHCADLAYAGYDDWYLPSKDELNLVYINRAAINNTAIENGGENFVDWYYWSSSEDINFIVWAQYFLNGSQTGVSKPDLCNVRAIRAF